LGQTFYLIFLNAGLNITGVSFLYELYVFLSQENKNKDVKNITGKNLREPKYFTNIVLI
jgi:hypothetical protein